MLVLFYSVLCYAMLCFAVLCCIQPTLRVFSATESRCCLACRCRCRCRLNDIARLTYDHIESNRFWKHRSRMFGTVAC